ncbi:MAG: hypothetical protein AUG51_20320 [Acidobacteria bacterium 13_1_20CM_3_53_8]|nr:MAG: hypothetical protein AUG51_20320 [Acidobacteria bacterium 13_1_20CM_3_53_8]
MTICERCNTENLDGSQYCDECGGPLRTAAAAAQQQDSAGAQTNGGAGGLSGQPERVEVPARAAQQDSVTVARQAAAAPAFAASSGSINLMEGAHARLIIERGRSAGKQFPLSEDESQIGRWDADGGIFPDVDLDADDPEAKVSRRHARIMRRNGQYFIEDLGSTNGTFINRGRRLLPGDRQPLRDGDEIIVGKTFLRFHVVK